MGAAYSVLSVLHSTEFDTPHSALSEIASNFPLSEVADFCLRSFKFGRARSPPVSVRLQESASGKIGALLLGQLVLFELQKALLHMSRSAYSTYKVESFLRW